MSRSDRLDRSLLLSRSELLNSGVLPTRTNFLNRSGLLDNSDLLSRIKIIGERLSSSQSILREARFNDDIQLLKLKSRKTHWRRNSHIASNICNTHSIPRQCETRCVDSEASFPEQRNTSVPSKQEEMRTRRTVLEVLVETLSQRCAGLEVLVEQLRQHCVVVLFFVVCDVFVQG